MPTLPTKSFAQIVSDTVVGIQGRAPRLLNFSIGSTLRAIVEGFAGIFLWYEALILQLLTAIRLNTSSGVDVDTFTADFMPLVTGTASPRLGAQAASGQVTFSRFTAGPQPCFVPVGTELQTIDGAQSYLVVADATYPSYRASPIAGYSMASQVDTLVVPIEAEVPGAAGNVQAGTITTVKTSVTGVDAAINVFALVNGADQESDSALKKRFSDYILGLSRGDIYGLTASIEGVDVTVQWTLTEDYNYDGSWRPGYFLVVADDGSGNPSPDFLQMVTDAANAVRPLGVQCAVFAPVIIWATVTMQLTVASGYDRNTIIAQVGANVGLQINNLGLGVDLPYTKLAMWAYAIPGVVAVTDVLLNGASGDAATISASKPTLDLQAKIGYGTIKCLSTVIS